MSNLWSGVKAWKKDPNYLLCYNCKKKFKAPQKKAAEETVKVSKKAKVTEEDEDQKYSNIPPKKVREKRETEMRKAYDELLAVENEDNKKKKKKRPKPEPEEDIIDDTYDDIYDEDDEDEEGGMSKLPIVILAIAIVIVGALIAYMLLFR